MWAQSTTVGVDALEPLADFADRHGLVFVDAPVLGTPTPAEDGKLTVLAAGPRAGPARPLAPVLDAVGQRTVWLAATVRSGAATRLKMVCNSWVLALNNGAAEALALARGLGVDPGASSTSSPEAPWTWATCTPRRRAIDEGRLHAQLPGRDRGARTPGS